MILLGLGATALSLISPVLQLRHLARVQTTAGLNLTALVMGSCVSGVWFLYGLARLDMALMVTYGLSLCLGMSVIVLVHRYARRSPVKPLVMVAVVLALLQLATGVLGSLVISIAAVVITVIKPGIQALTTIMSKDIRGISGSAYFLASASCTLWFLYGLVQSDAVTAWTSAWCAACYAIVVGGVTRKSTGPAVDEAVVGLPEPVPYVGSGQRRFFGSESPTGGGDARRELVDTVR